jgi:hypothetical protein
MNVRSPSRARFLPVADFYPLAAVCHQSLETFAQHPVECPVANYYIGFKVERQAERIEIAGTHRCSFFVDECDGPAIEICRQSESESSGSCSLILPPLLARFSRRTVAERRMRSLVIVKLAPFFNDDFSLAARYEPFPVQAFVTQLAVKRSAKPCCQGLPGLI